MASPFLSLGLTDWLVTACRTVGITSPTEIQTNCIPAILQGTSPQEVVSLHFVMVSQSVFLFLFSCSIPGRDVIGSAPTGSGKTAAFALPILQLLSKDPYGVYALVLSPTRFAFLFLFPSLFLSFFLFFGKCEPSTLSFSMGVLWRVV